MGRLIDCNDVYNAIQITTDNFGVAKKVVEDNMLNMLTKIPIVEAIPKAEIKKFLEEGTKDAGNNVLAIVREDYIHKSDYKNRLKADIVAMLEEISRKFDEQYYINRYQLHDDSLNRGLEQGQDIIQQKINSLKESKE